MYLNIIFHQIFLIAIMYIGYQIFHLIVCTIYWKRSNSNKGVQTFSRKSLYIHRTSVTQNSRTGPGFLMSTWLCYFLDLVCYASTSVLCAARRDALLHRSKAIQCLNFIERYGHNDWTLRKKKSRNVTFPMNLSNKWFVVIVYLFDFRSSNISNL